jgi:uncharacterized repeat protein (TIGR01451 family)
MRRSSARLLLAAVALALLVAGPALADTTIQSLPFSQNWTTTTLITTNDNWSGVPGIEGYLGQDITTSTGVDPQTLLTTSAVANDLDVIANQANPNTLTTGGVAEFDTLANPVVALQGSGTADAPYVIFYVNTTGCSGITVAYNLRDIDGAADNAVQPVALQFRVGAAGNFTNVPAGFVADATTGPSLATLVTPVSAVLPAGANGQAQVQVRVITANAAGSDEWVGVDDISITGTCGGPPTLDIGDVTQNETDAGNTTFTFTVSLSAPAGVGGVSFNASTADGTAQDDNPGTEDDDYEPLVNVPGSIPEASSSTTVSVTVNGDTTPEPNETFFVNIDSVVGATAGDVQGQGNITNDDITLNFIHDLQGNGAATPIPPATVVKVEGVVTADFQAANEQQGFFLQEEDSDADADPNTSEGIFVFCNTCPTPVAEGQRVQVTGTVSEFFNMTELTASTAGSVVVTDSGNNLAQVTPSPIDLPIVGVINDFYEAREGMKVTFVDTLSVAEYFELFRYGQVELYEGGRPRQFTEANPPSMAGLTAHLDNLDRRRVILDDDDNVQNEPLTKPNGSQFVFHPRANGGFSVGTQGTDFFRGADQINGLTGVLHWSFAGQSGTDAWRIRPTAANPATFTVTNPRPATPPAVGGSVKVAGMNLLNYFTTIDTTASGSSGPCAPSGTLDCRGADSTAELNRQRERASIVICAINADIFGLVELENTTASATITDLLGAVNTLCGGAHPYDFVNTGGTLGTDAIRVQLIYRTGIVSPVGPPLSDLDPVHNRPPTAQTFDVVEAGHPSFGQRFTVVANHLKSKGCPGTGGDADAGDGQSCFNATRVAQANQTLAWINGTVIPAAGDPDVLLLGDFNAYAQEDPITALVSGGYNDLETTFHGANAYSYLFDGQLGHLDYALSSGSLTPQVAGADAFHINADEVPLFDYNDEVLDSPGEAAFEEKPDGSSLVPPRVVFQPSSPYRASDHDPVVTGLFPITDLEIAKSASPEPVPAGSNVTYTITITNNGPNPAINAAWNDVLPSPLTFVSLSPQAGWSCNTPPVGSNGTVSCTNPSFAVGNVVFTLVANVPPATPPGPIPNTVTVTSVADSNTQNNSATAGSTTPVELIEISVE